MEPVEQMTQAARAFLASLDSVQSDVATAPFDVPDHREWTYLPGARPGLSMVELNAKQRPLALELLDAGCSEVGARTARDVIGIERIRRQLATGSDDLDGDRYWVRILGEPGGEAPWAWRVNGHHLAVHVTIAGGTFAVTPSFFGAEPAMVLEGPHKGLRTLVDEEDLARALLAELEPAQRSVAIVGDTAPDDIETRFDPVVTREQLTGGLAHANMSACQRDLLERLVRRYFDRAPMGYAEQCWQAVLDADLGAVQFAWAGSSERGRGHYYRVSGPTFLVEYDNTQDDANHIHSVWRDLANDWGKDILAAHYASHH